MNCSNELASKLLPTYLMDTKVSIGVKIVVLRGHVLDRHIRIFGGFCDGGVGGWGDLQKKIKSVLVIDTDPTAPLTLFLHVPTSLAVNINCMSLFNTFIFCDCYWYIAIQRFFRGASCVSDT